MVVAYLRTCVAGRVSNRLVFTVTSNTIDMQSLFQHTPSEARLTLCPWNAQYDKAKETATFTIAGESYTKWRSIASIRKKEIASDRDKASVIWKHGIAVVRASDKARLYYCYHCECRSRRQQWTSLHGTSMAYKHLTKSHGIAASDAGESLQPEANRKVFDIVTTDRYDGFKAAVVRWIVYCTIAFQMLENQYFRNVVSLLNKGFALLLPKDSATIRNWIKDEYDRQKDLLIEELAAAISKIHL